MSSLPSLGLSSSSSTKSSSSLSKNNTTVSTQKALRIIEDKILPYQQLDFCWTEIQVFWIPLRRFNKEDNDNSSSDEKKKKKKKITTASSSRASTSLKAARPPDSCYGVPEWRWCHMGLILVAESNHKNGDSSSDDDDGMQLRVLLDLHNSGIRIHHVFNKAGKAQRQIHDFLLELCAKNDDVPVFSAGVHEQITVPLDIIVEVVQTVKSYNVVLFNCQHFTSIAYYHFTGMHLSRRLRHRWTNTHSWSRNNNADSNNSSSRHISTCHYSSKNNAAVGELLHDDFLDVISKNPSLQRLQLVETRDEILFSYTPKLFGKSNRAAMVGGLVVSTLGGAMVTGLAVTAMGLGYDKIHPRLCPLSRVTIWFMYDGTNEREWFWSPYRFGEEGDGDDDNRWISVRHNRIRSGRYKGQELSKTAASIVRCLNQFNPKPLRRSSSSPEDDWNWDCPICWKSCVTYQDKVMCGTECTHAICQDCFGRMTKRNILHCPFCRKPFSKDYFATLGESIE